jgi:peptidoglycan-N-acetylglucosamine deacetylase
VEFPFAWVLDDAPFFQYSITLPGRTMQAPSAVAEAWKLEFDMLYREERQFCLAMHPQLTGRPSRLAALEDLIRHILAHPKVWFARCDDVAAAVRPILKAEAGR